MKKLFLLIGLVVFISTHAKAQSENIVDNIMIINIVVLYIDNLHIIINLLIKLITIY